jgi:tetratricopeptide (TPR) repeat protein
MKSVFFSFFLSLFPVFFGYSQTKNQLNQLATEAVYTKNYPKAIAYFTQVIDMDPSDSIAYLDRGMTKELNWELEGAIADFTQQQKIVEDCVDCFFLRGMLAEKMGNNRQAISDYHRVHRMEDGNADAHYFCGRIYLSQGKFSKALISLNDAIRVYESHVSALLDKSWIQLLKGENSAAIQNMRKAAQIEPENPVLHFFLANYYQAIGKSDSSMTCFAKTFELDPYFEIPSHIQESFKTFSKDKFSVKEITEFTKIQEPKKVVPKLLQLIGNYSASIEWYEKLDNAQNPLINYHLGICEFQLKNYSKARAYFKQVELLDPSNTNTYYWLALCELKLNQHQNACTYFKKYRDFEGKIRNIKNLGNCLDSF